jgi:hypothetical protein
MEAAAKLEQGSEGQAGPRVLCVVPLQKSGRAREGLIVSAVHA